MGNVVTLPVYVIKKGVAKLRDYNVYDAKRRGADIKIVHGDDSRIVLNKDIDKTFFSCGNKTIPTKITGAPDYKLLGMQFYKKEEKKKKVKVGKIKKLIGFVPIFA